MSATARRTGAGRVTSGSWPRPILRVDFAGARGMPAPPDHYALLPARVIRTLCDGTVFDAIPLRRYRSMAPAERLAWLATGEPAALLGPDLGGES